MVNTYLDHLDLCLQITQPVICILGVDTGPGKNRFLSWFYNTEFAYHPANDRRLNWLKNAHFCVHSTRVEITLCLMIFLHQRYACLPPQNPIICIILHRQFCDVSRRVSFRTQKQQKVSRWIYKSAKIQSPEKKEGNDWPW